MSAKPASREPESESTSLRVETTEESSVAIRLDVEVDVARVRRAFDRGYKELARKTRVRGFRPGKAPRSVLERMYGVSIAEDIERALVAETLPEAIEQAGLEPVAEPAIEADPPAPDANFSYKAHVEVKPEVSLPNTAGLPARRPAVTVDEIAVQGQLEELRGRHASVVEEPEGTVARNEHVLAVDFVGRVEGRPFEGGSGSGVEITLGEGRFIPGFEDQLLGVKAGEDREVSVRFPDEYGNEELAGKDAVFAVHVAEIKRRDLPDLDDEFAKDLGDFDSVAALRDRIRSDMTAQRERESKDVLRKSLMDALIERAPFDVPAGMVERQLQQRLAAAHERLHGQVPDEALHEQMDRWRAEWRGEAEREIRESLLLDAVAREREVDPSEEEVRARIAEMAEERGVDSTQLRKGLPEGRLEEAIRGQMREDGALDVLIAEAKVEETTDT